MAAPGGEWRISPDERAKSDAQFFSLKPINNVITGDQARGLFLQSGLPPVVLGQIWALADMNADGKMDKTEFCIAMHLIQKKLQGFEVPKVLPQSLLVETQAFRSMGGGSMGMTMGMFPASSAFGAPIGGAPTMPMHGLTNGGNPAMVGFGRGVPVAGFAAAPMTSPPPQPAASAASGDWGVPQPAKLKYTQKFNVLDKSKKGYLTGLEAREVLTQSNLTHNLLAQIWNLSDIDNDGKLTTDEFVLSMYLVDQARSGKVLPTKLPPELVPPSYRRTRSGSGVSAPAGVQITSPPGQVPGVPAMPASGMMAQKDAFGDLLGGYNMSAPPVQMEEPVLPLEPVQPVTFEDKRQENFIKGQAELERRRELLRAEQKKMEEERLAHERAEAEKRERVRLEQERKKQQEMEKLLQKQREMEEQREEQRRKALEQREAARREMERQRQLEWERQRREQLMSEKLREQNQVDQMKSEVGKLKMELENLETRKGELHMKIQGSRQGVTELTNSIDGMRGQRDEKLANIEKARDEVMTWNEKVQKIEAERQGIDQSLQLQNSTTNDTYRTVMHSYNSKKQTIEKLKATMEELEKETATKLEEIDKVNSAFNEINTQLTEINNKHQEFMSQLNSKQDEWKKLKRQQDGIPTPDKDEIITKASSWGFENAFDTTGQQSQSDAWGQSNAFPAPSTKTPATNGGGDVWGSDAFSTNTSAGGDGWWDSAPSISSTDKKDNWSIGATNQSNNSTNSLASLDWDSSNSLTKNSSVEWPNMGAQNPTTSNAPTMASNSWAGVASGSNALLDWDMSSASTNTTASLLDKPTDQQTKAETQTNLNKNQYMDPFGGVEHAGGSPPWPSEALSVSRPDPVDRSTSSEKELAGLWAEAAAGLTDNGALSVQHPGMSATSAAGSDVTLTQDMFSFDSPTASEPTKSQSADFWAGLSGGTEDAFGFGSSASQSQSSFAWSDAFLTKKDEPEPGVSYYRANFQFDARNPDELNLLPEDIVKVRQSKQEGAEPGWIFGTANGKGGWFPEAYVEKIPEDQPSVDATPTPEMSAVQDAQVTSPPAQNSFETDFSQQRAEEPAQAPSTLNLSNESSFKAVTTTVPSPTLGQGEQAEDGLKAQALYPWRAKKENHLTFNKGDVITVHEQQDMWWSGALGDRVGWFPKSYVKILGASTGNHSEAEPQIVIEGVDVSSSPAPEQNGGGEYYVSIYAYSSSEPGDLSFNQGDVIMVSKKEGDWWTGTINGLSGIFPANYVKEMETQVEVEEEEDQTTKEESPIQNSHAGQPQMLMVDVADNIVSKSLSTKDKPDVAAFADFGDFGGVASTEDPFAGTVQWGGGSGGDDNIWNPQPAPEAETATAAAEGAVELFGTEPFAAEPSSNEALNEQQDTQSAAGHTEEPSQANESPGQVNENEVLEDSNNSSATEENSDRATGHRAAPVPQPGAKLNKKPEIANVIAAYQATGQEQLSLMPGQLIQVRKKSQSGWWEGELQARGQKRKIGWFPANYVKLLGPSSARSTPDPNRASLSSSPMKCGSPNLSDAGSRTETPQPPQPTSAPALEQVMAIFSYEAQNSDELTFHKGSIINVILKDDPDWWKGEVNGQTGLFPSNYVSSLADAVVDNKESTGTSWPWSQHMAMSPTENKRQSAIQELIDTEETYVKDMKIVNEAFIKPLLADGAFTQEDIQRVFVNWKELIMCNTKILKAFRVRKKMTGAEQIIHMIGDILCEKLPHMTVYIRFCSCQLNAAALVQDKFEKDTNNFKEVHRKCIQHPGTKGMPLSSFLLKPIQRITKYPLLIEKILQNTPPEHPDNQNLQDALAKATEVCQQVNEGVREKENSDRLEWIQNRVNCEGLAEKITFNSVTNCLGPRKFLYSGTLCKAKSGKELIGFLFNDFLLLVQPQRPVGQMASVFSLDTKTNVNFRMYRTPVFLNEVMIKKTSEGETVDPNLFHLSHIDRVYSLKAVTATERDTWVKKIEEASRHYIETERKKRERAHSLRRAAALGRLLVVIMEGCKLSQGEDGKSDPYCEVSMGVQEHRTKVINNTLNPKWNASMQFTIKDLQEDVLCITVYDRDLFTPNDFLGRTEVRIKDIVKETREKKGPISKRLVLHEVETGEVVVKLDLQIYDIS